METSPNLLRSLTSSRNWTYSGFAQQFAKAAQELAATDGDHRLAKIAVSESTFRRWMNGGLSSLPNTDTCRVLEALFGHTARELFASALASHDRIPVLRDGRVSDQTEEIIRMAARNALRYTTVAHTDLNATTVDAMTAEAARLASVYPTTPPTQLLPDLLNLQELAHRLLESRHRPAVDRDLHLVAALANGMLAKASHDQGDPHAAMMLGRAAYMAAELAGHPGVMMWVRGIQSLAAYWAGWHSQAAELARSVDPETASGTVTAWLPALEARAAAAMGDAAGAVKAADRADRAREELLPSELDAHGGLLSFGVAQHLYYRAEALMLAERDTPAAMAAADEAVNATSSRDASDRAFGDEAGARTLQAIARIARQDVDGGLEAIGPVLELAPEFRVNGVVVCTERVIRALPPAGPAAPRAAAQIREALEEFGHTSLKALAR